MKYHPFYLALMVLILAAFACNLPSNNEPTPTETTASQVVTVESPVVTQQIATDTPQATLPESATPTVDLIQTEYPVGFSTVSDDGETVTFHDLSGIPLGSIVVPGFSAGKDQFHIAGPFTGDPNEVPVFYLTFENMGNIKKALQGQISTVFPGPDVVSLRGATAQYAFVYTTVTWAGETLNSYFYLQTAYGGGASWVWERVDPASWALKPMALVAENSEPQTIFFTLEPWGIGGDIVFPPRKGLFQLNLEFPEKVLLLTEDFNPIGLSPDTQIVAYTETNNEIGAQNQSRITLYNLTSGLMVPIDLASTSDRGGGYAVFSPDNDYVAWMEASGWLMSESPNFHSRVRIANLDGVILADIPVVDFSNLVGDPSATWAIPAAWLDNETLLVEVRGDNWNFPALVAVRFDGSGMVYLASGVFLSLLYP